MRRCREGISEGRIAGYNSVCQKTPCFSGDRAESGGFRLHGTLAGPVGAPPGASTGRSVAEHMANIRASAGPRARRSGPRSGGTFHGPVHRWTPRSGGGGEHGALPLLEHQAGAVDVRAGTASATAPAKPFFPWPPTRSRPRCSRLLMADPPAAWAPASRQAPAGPGGRADRGRSSPPTGRGTGPAPPRPWGPPRPRRSPPT